MSTELTQYDVIELDAISGEIVYRNFNDTESAQREVDLEKFAAEKLEEAAKAEAKAALLERLGITEEEAALLLA
jgi:hypothetical protein